MDPTAWDQRYAQHHAEHGLVWSPAPNALFVEQVTGTTPGTAIDLGCGEGRNAVWLAEQGWDVTGIDFSAVALSAARELAAQAGVTVAWEQADVTQWAPEHAYDLVAVLYLHIPSATRRQVMRAAAGAVAPGGKLVLIGHDLDNLTRGVGGPPDPDIHYTVGDVVAAVSPPLDVVEARQAERMVERDGEKRAAIDTLVVAVR